jgi:hypothetical protein
MEPICGVDLIPASRMKMICCICEGRGACTHCECKVKGCSFIFHPICGHRYGLTQNTPEREGEASSQADRIGFCPKHLKTWRKENDIDSPPPVADDDDGDNATNKDSEVVHVDIDVDDMNDNSSYSDEGDSKRSNKESKRKEDQHHGTPVGTTPNKSVTPTKEAPPTPAKAGSIGSIPSPTRIPSPLAAASFERSESGSSVEFYDSNPSSKLSSSSSLLSSSQATDSDSKRSGTSVSAKSIPSTTTSTNTTTTTTSSNRSASMTSVPSPVLRLSQPKSSMAAPPVVTTMSAEAQFALDAAAAAASLARAAVAAAAASISQQPSSTSASVTTTTSLPSRPSLDRSTSGPPLVSSSSSTILASTSNIQRLVSPQMKPHVSPSTRLSLNRPRANTSSSSNIIGGRSSSSLPPTTAPLPYNDYSTAVPSLGYKASAPQYSSPALFLPRDTLPSSTPSIIADKQVVDATVVATQIAAMIINKSHTNGDIISDNVVTTAKNQRVAPDQDQPSLVEGRKSSLGKSESSVVESTPPSFSQPSSITQFNTLSSSSSLPWVVQQWQQPKMEMTTVATSIGAISIASTLVTSMASSSSSPSLSSLSPVVVVATATPPIKSEALPLDVIKTKKDATSTIGDDTDDYDGIIDLDDDDDDDDAWSSMSPFAPSQSKTASNRRHRTSSTSQLPQETLSQPQLQQPQSQSQQYQHSQQETSSLPPLPSLPRLSQMSPTLSQISGEIEAAAITVATQQIIATATVIGAQIASSTSSKLLSPSLPTLPSLSSLPSLPSLNTSSIASTPQSILLQNATHSSSINSSRPSSVSTKKPITPSVASVKSSPGSQSSLPSKPGSNIGNRGSNTSETSSTFHTTRVPQPYRSVGSVAPLAATGVAPPTTTASSSASSSSSLPNGNGRVSGNGRTTQNGTPRQTFVPQVPLQRGGTKAKGPTSGPSATGKRFMDVLGDIRPFGTSTSSRGGTGNTNRSSNKNVFGSIPSQYQSSQASQQHAHQAQQAPKSSAAAENDANRRRAAAAWAKKQQAANPGSTIPPSSSTNSSSSQSTNNGSNSKSSNKERKSASTSSSSSSSSSKGNDNSKHKTKKAKTSLPEAPAASFADRQRALFEQARARLGQRTGVPLPSAASLAHAAASAAIGSAAAQAYQQQAALQREKTALATSHKDHVPSWFVEKPDGVDYTDDERRSAIQMLLKYNNTTPSVITSSACLCLHIPTTASQQGSGMSWPSRAIITKHYRRMALLVHPDKTRLDRAADAFKILSTSHQHLIGIQRQR